MAPVFTAYDIARIAGAFHPVTPTAQKPSLVWNSANDRLVQSTKVLSRFDSLLNGEHGKIVISSLSKSLDTRQTDWLLASRNNAVYSANLESILTEPEVDRLVAGVIEAAQQRYTDLEEFLSDRDIDRATLLPRLESKIELIPDSHSRSSRIWLATKTLHTQTIDRVTQLLETSPEDHKTDLSANLPDVPRNMIRQLAESIAQSRGIKGTVRSGKTRITFLSAAYEAMLKDQQAKKVAREFSKILVQTHRSGFHPVPENSDDAPGLREVFFERTKAGLDDGSFSMIHSGERPIALAFTNQLEVVLDELKVNACHMVSESWKSNGAVHTTTTLDAARLEKLTGMSSSQDFAKLMLQDIKYRSAIQQSMQTRLDELEGVDLQQCNEAFNEYVRVPIRLYLSGLNDVRDANLRQRLEDYILEYLSKDLIPQGLRHTFDEKHSRNNTLSKEMEKFGEFCLAANSLYELQSGLSRFARKQKLEHIPLDEELEVKKRILEQKLKSMRRMIRGSDILQNLVWILLAQEYHGLFISSGRDTTRMIRFYQINGDEDIGGKLDVWRDRFKAGQESREDFEEMRSLAEEIVRRINMSGPELEAEDDGSIYSQDTPEHAETVAKDSLNGSEIIERTKDIPAIQVEDFAEPKELVQPKEPEQTST